MTTQKGRKHLRLKDTVGLDFFVIGGDEQEWLIPALKADTDVANFVSSHFKLTKLLETISLSLGGISFTTKKNIKVGTQLLISLVLLPSEINIFVIAEVIECEVDPDNKERYLLHAEFDLMSETNLTALSYHINKKLEG